MAGIITKGAVAGLVLALGACSGINTVSRNAPFEAATGAISPEAQQVPITIASYKVTVPRDLKASEANLFYPSADIIWREDPQGDRHAQVAAIFENSVRRSAGLMSEGRPVNVAIEVTRFHALTKKARYTTGGTHSLSFILSATDAETGAELVAPHRVKADLKAYGGQRAIKAERAGMTQKFRITNHLTKVIYRELTGREAPSRPAETAMAASPETPATASGTIARN